jgi:hypothetical protein
MREMVEEHEVRAEELIGAFGKKIGILEITQQQKVNANAAGNKYFFCPVFLSFINKLAPGKITANGKQQQDEEYAACFVVKEKANGQQVNGSRLAEFVEEGIEHQHHSQEEPEEQLRKQQRFILLVGHNVLQDMF